MSQKRYLLAAGLLLFSIKTFGQSPSIVVVDSLTGEALIGATVRFDSTGGGAATDSDGRASLAALSPGRHRLTINYVGYLLKNQSVVLPLPGGELKIKLVPEPTGIGEVTVASTRSNSSVEMATQKIEVLAAAELAEESTIKPGNIASLLGDLSVIHIQPTSATSGASSVRMQGLGGQYTQLLRDGLPLYEGFSGNFGVLQIAPLDLRQVEILKGSNSTLYGGGAIGGLINFISKKPGDRAIGTSLFNQSSLGETNINNFYASKAGRWAWASFIGLTRQTPRDVNSDGLSDVPKLGQVNFHPAAFFNPNSSLSARLGFSAVVENRNGGQMDAIKNGASTEFPFLEKNWQRRTGLDFSIEKTFRPGHALTAKGVVSRLDQRQSVLQNRLDGIQTQGYAELSESRRFARNRAVWGATFNFSKFDPTTSSSPNVVGQTDATPGVFAQDELVLSPKSSLEGGIRIDRHNRAGLLPLPHLALRFSPMTALTARLSAGAGYKTPQPLLLADLPREVDLLPTFDIKNLKTERSRSLNADIQWKKTLPGDIEIHLDQAFYATEVRRPLEWSAEAKTFSNSPSPLRSIGTDTYLAATYSFLELYLGYNHTEAWQDIGGNKTFAPFAPQDKLALTLAFDLPDSGWRGGVEAARNGNQYLPSGKKAPDWWFFAASISKKVRRATLTLNCENLLDYRQSRKEALFSGPVSVPVFAPLWAPIDGRAVNFSVKVEW